MKLLISKCDYLSHKVSLTLNEKGDVGYKTFIGGLISIFLIGSSTICILYFIFTKETGVFESIIVLISELNIIFSPSFI